MSTASQTCGKSSEVGTVAGVAAALVALRDHRVDAPAAATFSAWRRAPMVGIVRSPASFSVAISSLLGRLREARDAHASRAIMSSIRVEHVRLIGAQVHAERLVGALLDARGSRVSSSGDGHRRRAEDAEAAGVAGRRGEPGARDPAHAGLHDRVADAEQIAEPGVEHAMRLFAGAPTEALALMRELLLSEPARIDDVRG